MDRKPKDVVEASAETSSLPDCATCTTSGSREVTVSRLSWLQFEDLWTELAELLSVLAGSEAESPEELADKLSSAPQFVKKLVALSTGSKDAALSGWPFDDVLTVASCALRLNFIDSAGVRSFFGALLDLGDEG